MPHEKHPSISVDLDPLIDFEFWMTDPERAHSYSAQTVKIYMRVTRAFYDYIIARGIGAPEEVGSSWILAYANTMRGSGLADNSIHTYLAALNTFYDYLIDRAFVAENPVAAVQKRYLERKHRNTTLGRGLPVLNTEERARFIEVIARRRHKNQKRDLALVGFLLDTGLRIEELATLTLAQGGKALVERELTIRLPDEPARTFGILTDYAAYVRDYIRSRSGEGGHAGLFAARTGSPISGALAHKLISRYLREAGIDKPQTGSNLLRHTAAYRMLAAGFSEDEVQLALGQVSPVSIGLYSCQDHQRT